VWREAMRGLPLYCMYMFVCYMDKAVLLASRVPCSFGHGSRRARTPTGMRVAQAQADVEPKKCSRQLMTGIIVWLVLPESQVVQRVVNVSSWEGIGWGIGLFFACQMVSQVGGSSSPIRVTVDVNGTTISPGIARTAGDCCRSPVARIYRRGYVGEM
jgi:hypothetical protein